MPIGMKGRLVSAFSAWKDALHLKRMTYAAEVEARLHREYGIDEDVEQALSEFAVPQYQAIEIFAPICEAVSAVGLPARGDIIAKLGGYISESMKLQSLYKQWWNFSDELSKDSVLKQTIKDIIAGSDTIDQKWLALQNVIHGHSFQCGQKQDPALILQ